MSMGPGEWGGEEGGRGGQDTPSQALGVCGPLSRSGRTKHHSYALPDCQLCDWFFCRLISHLVEPDALTLLKRQLLTRSCSAAGC